MANELRNCLAVRMRAGMRVSTICELANCSRPTVWRIRRGGRIKSRVAASILAGLARQSLSDPEIFPEGIDDIEREWRRALAPIEQRRIIRRFTDFVVDTLLLTKCIDSIASAQSVLTSGRPGSPLISITKSNGRSVSLRIVAEYGQPLVFILSDSSDTEIFNRLADSRTLRVITNKIKTL